MQMDIRGDGELSSYISNYYQKSSYPVAQGDGEHGGLESYQTLEAKSWCTIYMPACIILYTSCTLIPIWKKITFFLICGSAYSFLLDPHVTCSGTMRRGAPYHFWPPCTNFLGPPMGHSSGRTRELSWFSKAMRAWIPIYASILICVLSCLVQGETR